MIDEATCWQAVQQKDASLDGQFVYGVLTTKVFCRPGCRSRTPLRRNVRFYPSPAEAAASGLRPCLRCKPLEPFGGEADALRRQFQQVCAYLRRHLDDRAALQLSALGRRFGLSPFHLQRSFKSVVGVTPRQYVEAIRMQTLKENLRGGESVTDAIYDAGFGAPSRVYDGLDASLGMTPRQYRAGGANVEISYAQADTPLGLVMIGATDRGLCFLEFGDSAGELLESLRQEYPAAHPAAMAQPYSAQFTAWMQQLAGFLVGERALSPMPVALYGTAFQLKVWRYLQTIPSGSVQSYAEVATAIGQPKAARAVASACAANRIAVVVPCHRVIRGDGTLGGYRWGLERKRVLLDAERSAFSRPPRG
jgi:AraC family transcriptional regulator of adaptative response/methylated-DNA-[protein]-cysteine methyltransferase